MSDWKNRGKIFFLQEALLDAQTHLALLLPLSALHLPRQLLLLSFSSSSFLFPFLLPQVGESRAWGQEAGCVAVTAQFQSAGKAFVLSTEGLDS